MTRKAPKKNKVKPTGEDKIYNSISFTTYIHSRNGNFSTSASYVKNSSSQDSQIYQTRNKVTGKMIYATKRK